MLPNTNPETGIRYGVVKLDSLADWAFDEFFNNGRNVTADAALAEAVAEGLDPEDDEATQQFWDGYQGEEETYELETDGMRLMLSYLGGAPLVWVFQSPVTTEARLCSPCVPGAGDLDNQEPGAFTCYSLPIEWFHFDTFELYGKN